MKTNNQEVSTAKPFTNTIAVVQIARLGDLIQTVQAVQCLKLSNPEYRLILIARSQFVTPLKFILEKTFDKIYSLDTQKIFQDHQANGFKKSLSHLDTFLSEINVENIDVLINLSFSKSSSYLMSAITAEHKIGPFRNLDNNVQINDKWSQVLYSTVMRGSFNPYSLVDFFKNIIGIKPTNILNTSPGQESNSNLVVIHPFASTERKSWKPEKWVEVIYKTLKDNDKINIAIVGDKKEFARAQIISDNPLLKNYSARITNLAGKTTLESLSHLLSATKLFIGHDSMVGHLAAINKTTTLTISLGNVRPHETTPYHSNAYNIAPKTKCFPCFPTDTCTYNQCHHDIPYQLVIGVIKQLISNNSIDAESIKSSQSSFHLSSVNLYRSNFKNGQFLLESLIDAPSDIHDIFRTFYRISWSFVLNDNVENFPFPKLTLNTHKDLLDTITGLQHLFELSEFGQKYSRYILEEISSATPSISKIKEFSKKIDEIDHLQTLVQKTAPYLAPIIDYFTVRKGNLHGDNIVKLTESSYYCFEENSHLCSIMYELVQNTIAEYKISNNKNKNPHMNK